MIEIRDVPFLNVGRVLESNEIRPRNFLIGEQVFPVFWENDKLLEGLEGVDVSSPFHSDNVGVLVKDFKGHGTVEGPRVGGAMERESNQVLGRQRAPSHWIHAKLFEPGKNVEEVVDGPRRRADGDVKGLEREGAG